MKLNKLETKTGAGKGAFLHLRHPALDHLLYTGEGADDDGMLIDKDKATKVGCYVLGMESERVRERAKAIQRAKMKSGGDENAEDIGIEFVSSLVTEFVGVEDENGKPLKADDEGKRLFFSQSDGLVEQVMKFAGDRANFFKGGSTA